MSDNEEQDEVKEKDGEEEEHEEGAGEKKKAEKVEYVVNPISHIFSHILCGF